MTADLQHNAVDLPEDPTPDWVTRLRDEIDELSERLQKLHDFINDEDRPELEGMQMHLLQTQYGAMVAYHGILIMRLASV